MSAGGAIRAGRERLLGGLLAAQVVVVALTLGLGCGPDDLAPGVLPGALVMYDPTSKVTTGTAITTGARTVTIATITPNPVTLATTAVTVLTITGSGFIIKPNQTAVGFARPDGIATPAGPSSLTLNQQTPSVAKQTAFRRATVSSVASLTLSLPLHAITGDVTVITTQTPWPENVLTLSHRPQDESLPRVLTVVPAISVLTPIPATRGTSTPLTVFGTGFAGVGANVSLSQVKVELIAAGQQTGTRLEPLQIAYFPNAPARLQVILPTSLAAGIYTAKVVIDGTLTSSPSAPFVVN